MSTAAGPHSAVQESPPTAIQQAQDATAGPAWRPEASEDDLLLYNSDDFRIWCMKVIPCTKRFVHDWSVCPFAHAGEKAVRRDPRTHEYTGIACPDMKKTSTCLRGDSCPYAHNVFEYWLHPTRYRTQLCNDGPSCKRSICFFAHSLDELRTPAVKPYVSPEALARSSLQAIHQNPHPLGQQLAGPMRAGPGRSRGGTAAAMPPMPLFPGANGLQPPPGALGAGSAAARLQHAQHQQRGVAQAQAASWQAGFGAASQRQPLQQQLRSSAEYARQLPDPSLAYGDPSMATTAAAPPGPWPNLAAAQQWGAQAGAGALGGGALPGLALSPSASLSWPPDPYAAAGTPRAGGRAEAAPVRRASWSAGEAGPSWAHGAPLAPAYPASWAGAPLEPAQLQAGLPSGASAFSDASEGTQAAALQAALTGRLSDASEGTQAAALQAALTGRLSDASEGTQAAALQAALTSRLSDARTMSDASDATHAAALQAVLTRHLSSLSDVSSPRASDSTVHMQQAALQAVLQAGQASGGTSTASAPPPGSSMGDAVSAALAALAFNSSLAAVPGPVAAAGAAAAAGGVGAAPWAPAGAAQGPLADSRMSVGSVGASSAGEEQPVSAPDSLPPGIPATEPAAAGPEAGTSGREEASGSALAAPGQGAGAQGAAPAEDLAHSLANMKIALTQQQLAASAGTNHEVVISTLHTILRDAAAQHANQRQPEP